MAGRGAIAALVAGMMLSAQTPPPVSPPQDASPIVVVGPDADIVVIGGRPAIRGGLWQFTRSGTLELGRGNSGRGLRFTTCLADGTLVEALQTLAGERSAIPRSRICGALRLKVTEGRVTGTRSCMVPSLAIGTGAKGSRLDVSGRYDSRRLTINFLSEDEFDGAERGGGAGWVPKRPTAQRWRAEAVRIGDCPASRRLDQRTTEEAVRRLFDPVVTPDAD